MLYLICDFILYTLPVKVAIRCVSRISTLSSMFIQYKDLLVRIETPPALRAVGVSIRTCRSFYWMNTSDKVDILYVSSSFWIKTADKVEQTSLTEDLIISQFLCPPTSEKLRGHIGLGLSVRLSVSPSVRLSVTRWQLRNSRTAYARILKLYMWHVHEK